MVNRAPQRTFIFLTEPRWFGLTDTRCFCPPAPESRVGSNVATQAGGSAGPPPPPAPESQVGSNVAPQAGGPAGPPPADPLFFARSRAFPRPLNRRAFGAI